MKTLFYTKLEGDEMSKSLRIVLNGSELTVKEVKFDEADIMSDEYYHDCYITFLDGEITRYDACDVIVVG